MRSHRLVIGHSRLVSQLRAVWSGTPISVKSNGGRVSADEIVSCFPHRFFRCDDVSQWQRSAACDVIGPRRNQCARLKPVCPRHERDRIDAGTVRPGPLRRIVLSTRFACAAGCLSTNVIFYCLYHFRGCRRRVTITLGCLFM